MQKLFECHAGLWDSSSQRVVFQKCIFLSSPFISLRILLFFLVDVPWCVLWAVFNSPSDEFPPLILLRAPEVTPYSCIISARLRCPRQQEHGGHDREARVKAPGVSKSPTRCVEEISRVQVRGLLWWCEFITKCACTLVHQLTRS